MPKKNNQVKKVLRLKDVVEAYNILKNVNLATNPEFNYVLAKNLLTLEREYEPIEQAIRPSKEFEEFTQRFNELKSVYKNAPEKLENALDKLKDEYKDAIEQRKKQIDETEKMLLEKEVKITIERIDRKDIPEKISTQVYTAMMKIGMI